MNDFFAPSKRKQEVDGESAESKKKAIKITSTYQPYVPACLQNVDSVVNWRSGDPNSKTDRTYNFHWLFWIFRQKRLPVEVVSYLFNVCTNIEWNFFVLSEKYFIGHNFPRMMDWFVKYYRSDYSPHSFWKWSMSPMNYDSRTLVLGINLSKYYLIYMNDVIRPLIIRDVDNTGCAHGSLTACLDNPTIIHSALSSRRVNRDKDMCTRILPFAFSESTTRFAKTDAKKKEHFEKMCYDHLFAGKIFPLPLAEEDISATSIRYCAMSPARVIAKRLSKVKELKPDELHPPSWYRCFKPFVHHYKGEVNAVDVIVSWKNGKLICEQ